MKRIMFSCRSCLSHKPEPQLGTTTAAIDGLAALTYRVRVDLLENIDLVLHLLNVHLCEVLDAQLSDCDGLLFTADVYKKEAMIRYGPVASRRWLLKVYKLTPI